MMAVADEALAGGGPAPASAERVVAGAVGTFRAGSVLLLAGALTASAAHWHQGPLGVLVAVAGVQCRVSVVCWRTGRLQAVSAQADLVLLAVSATPLVSVAQSGLAPLYHFALIASIEAGVVDWPLWAVLGSSGIFYADHSRAAGVVRAP